MYAQEYAKAVFSILNEISAQEGERIRQAGLMLADTLARDGLLHVFGCGHSHILEEELFYRAGGLAAVNPLFDTGTMLHESATQSSRIERMSGYAPFILERYSIQQGDCFLIATTSGINPLPIEMAQRARMRGAKVIGITSFAYRDKASRHPEGFHIADVCDICIDSHVPEGDAAVTVRSDGTKAGPVSSIANLLIANSIVLEACEALKSRGIEPEVFVSGNVEGGDAHNDALVTRFRARVRPL